MQLETGSITRKFKTMDQSDQTEELGLITGTPQHSQLTVYKATGHAHVLPYTNTHPSQVLTSAHHQGVEYMNKLNDELMKLHNASSDNS